MPNKETECKELHQRMHDLETKSAFQEDSVNQLNAVIIEQQQQIDHLHIVIEALRGAVQSTNSGSTIRSSAEEEKPPHY